MARGIPGAQEAALTGGDDYELLFTASPERRPEIKRLGERLDLPLTQIGRIESGSSVTVRDASGQPLSMTRGGWRHF